MVASGRMRQAILLMTAASMALTGAGEVSGTVSSEGEFMASRLCFIWRAEGETGSYVRKPMLGVFEAFAKSAFAESAFAKSAFAKIIELAGSQSRSLLLLWNRRQKAQTSQYPPLAKGRGGEVGIGKAHLHLTMTPVCTPPEPHQAAYLPSQLGQRPI